MTATLSKADLRSAALAKRDALSDEQRAVAAQAMAKRGQADSDAIPIARVNGMTTAAVMPSGGILSGDVAVMNLDGWTWEEATVKPSAGIVFSFPAVAGGGGRARRRRWTRRRRRRRRRHQL